MKKEAVQNEGETLMKNVGVADIDPAHSLYIKGASLHNLKNINVELPKGKFIAVSGLSGSGKSSLIMDTLYAEGQRRYVESLSSYARQFLTQMKKPEVDYIKGLSPAIAIEQRTVSSNARSTVGSLTELNDYFRLLYARAGIMYSPISGERVRKHEVADVVDYLFQLDDGDKVYLTFPLYIYDPDRKLGKELELLLKRGYTRLYFDSELLDIEDILAGDTALKTTETLAHYKEKGLAILVDRLVITENMQEMKGRIADSVSTAFMEGNGTCQVVVLEKETKIFTDHYALDGIDFPEPSPQLFNYNNPYGACPTCEGYGRIIGISEDKVIPDPLLSVYDGAVACWSGQKSGRWRDRFLRTAPEHGFPIHRPYEELTQEQRDFLWNGYKNVKGIKEYFKRLEAKAYKIQNRVLLARYRGRTSCPECHGYRLRKEALYVKVGDRHIAELLDMPIDELYEHMQHIQLNEFQEQVSKRLLKEINHRLRTMVDIGLGYLKLDRLSSTLSGGESQRIYLTRTLGSNLTNSIYILDEPSIGLHPRDSDQLIGLLKELRDLGNTVIVVEHEEEILRAADHLLELGPEAGVHGGNVVFNGSWKEFAEANPSDSYTAQYLLGNRAIPVPQDRRKPKKFIELKGARKFNIHNVDVSIPLKAMTVVTGVSGSGKSTLIKEILIPSIEQGINHNSVKGRETFQALEGDWKRISKVEYVDQNPIGRSSRSNPATYIKAYTKIRELMASQKLAQIRGFKKKHFSFNVKGGRCENCQGDGSIAIEMQFLPDVNLVCEVCNGKRFKKEVLEVEYKGKNIADILDMSIDEAIDFFEDEKLIQSRLQALQDVGLGYVCLGQASNTLSGGEAQRVKLAYYLSHENPDEHILFAFDEPTTGLHLHDIHKLLKALNALIDRGHTVLIIEHNMDVIKCADWLIDLGPGGGKHGGKILYQGLPEGLVDIKESHTADFLKDKLTE